MCFKKVVIFSISFFCILSYGLTDKQIDSVKKQLEQLQLKQKNNYLQATPNLKTINLDNYLKYKQISQNPEIFTQEQITNYINSHQNEYWASALCDELAIHYAKNKNWEMFKKFYDGNLETDGKCWIAQNNQDEKFRQKAIIDFTKFWQDETPSAYECTDIQTYWKDYPNKGKDCVVEKAYTLAFSNSFDHALALLDKHVKQQSYNDYINAWKEVTDNPQNLDNFIAKYHNYPKFDEVLIDISDDLTKNNPQKYAKIWQGLKNTKYLDTKLYNQAMLPIAISLAKNHDATSEQWFLKIDSKYYTNDAWQWLLRADLYNSDYNNYIRTYQKLPENLQKEDVWRYWLAYSYAKNGYKSKANTIYQELADKKGFDYYVLLSADALGQSYDLGSKNAIEISKSKYAELLKDHNTYQAIALYKAKQYKDSTRLWRWIIRQKFDSKDRFQIYDLAELASYNEMHYQAIFAMGMLGIKSRLELLFPNPFTDLINEQSKKYDLEESLIFAIMRRESLFYRDASSSVGAKGLMQVTDSTANFIAKRYKLTNFEEQQIYNSTINIKVGSANLDFLAGLFKNNIVLSIAAYNAGPGNVANWLTNREIPAKQWIENIPFVETRNYVRHVLVNMVVYDNLVLKDNNIRLSDLLQTKLSNKLSFKK